MDDPGDAQILNDFDTFRIPPFSVPESFCQALSPQCLQSHGPGLFKVVLVKKDVVCL